LAKKVRAMNSRFGSTLPSPPKSFPVADICMVLLDPTRTTPSKSVSKKKRPERKIQ